MLGNIKDFITVVQDGLSSSNNLRQTIQEVQKVKNIFKDKHKAVKESKVNYGAGGALLEKYQEQWAELHENSEKNAKAAEDIDRTVMELHHITKRQLQSANALAQNLSQLPDLTVAVAQCLDNLRNIQILMKTVEDELADFEDIVERRKMERWKLDHHYHLTIYKEKKMAALEEVRMNLAKEKTEQACEIEKRQLAELQMRREQSSAAFQQDIVKYLQSGLVPSGPPASPKLTLEQVQLDDDPSDLENFLST